MRIIGTLGRIATGRRRLAITVMLAAVVGLLSSTAVAVPAQAALVCGATKSVDSGLITYRACDAPAAAAHKYTGQAQFHNGYGETVEVLWQEGVSYQGGAVQWYPVTYSTDIPANSSSVTHTHSCTTGQSTRYIVRVQDISGAWGAGSFATAVICP